MNKEHPIIFNGVDVRAILDGTKTQTRRVIKPQPPPEPYKVSGVNWGRNHFDDRFYFCGAKRPWDIGDKLWIRETWSQLCPGEGKSVIYRADMKHPTFVRFKPSIHMPRWASRIDLEITGIRVERVQAISEEDAKAEGCSGLICECPDRDENYGCSECENTGWWHRQDPITQFQSLWNSINEKRGFGWDKNPWVWVREFKRIEL